ncbi:hypothetical protein HYC85_020479 [Camellia sinensis]|uniref:Uncharacterized protein n=1 Tax=Camellia sinensis TaxID=4442 RepID=A0A7J7GQU7_CAMSI|nr:hypothetical protein HYC85_020479 [Camellia sinensis]
MLYVYIYIFSFLESGHGALVYLNLSCFPLYNSRCVSLTIQGQKPAARQNRMAGDRGEHRVLGCRVEGTTRKVHIRANIELLILHLQDKSNAIANCCVFSVDKIFPSSTQTSSQEEAIKMRKMLPNFFKPEALQRYIGIMDTIAHQHFAADWDNKV